MKVLLKTTSFLFVGALILLGASCTEFLDETDPSNFTKENYFTQPAHAESAVNAIYDALKPTTGGGFNGAPWMMLEFATGLANTELGQAQNSIFVRNLINNSDNDYGRTYWQSYYRGIANANLALDRIPAIPMDDKLKQKALGQAYFLRAHFYFDLVRIFGNIPLITTPIDLSSPELYPKPASVEEVYKRIEDDLLAAEMSGLSYTDKTGRVSMGAVKSLLAEVYLTMAGFPLQKGIEYFKKSADKANEVIASNQFNLFPNYNDLHDPAKKNIGENIFMVQFAAFVQPSELQVAIIPYNQGISAYASETGAIFANKEFVESYSKGDKRAEEKQFYYRSFTSKVDRSKVKDLGGYYIYKHFDTAAQLSTASSDLNWSLIRYAQVLLTFAEASNEANGPNPMAYQAVNSIRKRAMLPDLGDLTKEQLRETIRMERVFELSFENKTWFDMARWRKAFNVNTRKFDEYVGHKFSYGPTLSQRELLFPIPTAEVRNNKNLTQNTGY